MQSVTNWAIFITVVSGFGEEGGEGEGAEAQPLQLALQTRTCSVESGNPSKLEQEWRRLGPQSPPACPSRSGQRGSPLFLSSCYLL